MSLSKKTLILSASLLMLTAQESLPAVYTIFYTNGQSNAVYRNDSPNATHEDGKIANAWHDGIKDDYPEFSPI